MKRFLHALAVLWLGKTIPLRTRPTACESADSPIRKIIQSPPSELADQQISESAINNKTIFHLNRRYCNVLVYIALFMCLTAAKQVSAQAEPAAAAIQPLQIGDAVPEELWHLPLEVVNHPEGRETITLNDYRGKLIILDFWATWCGACVAMMPKMDSLQRELGDKIQFIAVTYQQAGDVLPFLERLQRQNGRQSEYPGVTDDTMLGTVFPHRTLPHYVWIGVGGEVMAATELSAINAHNIGRAAHGQPVGLAQKESPAGNPYNPRNPLFKPLEEMEREGALLFSTLTGYHEGVSGGGRYLNINQQSDAKYRRITCYNQGVAKLYQTAYGKVRPLRWNRTVLQVSDLSRLRSSAIGQEYRDWLRNGNGFCYELIIAADKADIALEKMRNDLSLLFPQYRASLEEMEVECLVLRSKAGNYSKLQSKGGEPRMDINIAGGKIQNQKHGLAHLVARLDVYMQGLSMPVLDETAFDGAIDMELDAPLDDPCRINEELARYGLLLEKTTRHMEVLVIRDRTVHE